MHSTVQEHIFRVFSEHFCYVFRGLLPQSDVTEITFIVTRMSDNNSDAVTMVTLIEGMVT